MKNKKYIPMILLGSLFMTSQVSAQMLRPSLESQMHYQTQVDIQVQANRRSAEADARLAEIRAKNQERMRALNSAATNVVSEPQIDEQARNEALSRVVYRNPINGQSNAPIASVSADNPAVSVNYSPESRTVGNVDMARVEQAWLGWVNGLRSEKGLAPYSTHHMLGKTAQEWAEFSRDRGYTTHGRPGDGCIGATNYGCYNFGAIDKWFTERGVNAIVLNRSKHTENLGFGAFRCSHGDCTQAAIDSIRKTYNFFLSEKAYNGVHYRTMVNPNFQKMGLGFAEKNGTYYLAIHYATDLK
ncbi:MAG: CAP domain-containing protein [Candidatus Gracilibacteria bacterium]|nr:CAP domain-containing protein [Candidatus Gracilibacteria bacterium]